MKVKVKIFYEGTTIDYDLNREADLNAIIEVACLNMSIKGPKTDYVLQMDSTKEYLTPSVCL